VGRRPAGRAGLAFDFMNGFHDAANSIATVVSTGVLKPTQAVLFAAFFNFIAIFIFHLSVAATVGKGIVQPGVVDTHVVFGALVGPSPGTSSPGTTAFPAVPRTR
jgi:PiT family inorganic phosphate transporter